MKTIKIIIKGTVQGVFFREFIKEHAILLNLKGYTKNLPNRNVEAVFQGEPNQIEKMINYCKQGPRTSKPTSITRDIPPKQTFKEFKILH